MAKRVGANRQKKVNELRANRPRRIANSVKIIGLAVIALSVGFFVYTCSPTVTGRISSAVHSGQQVSADISIVNCSAPVAARLHGALVSLQGADSLTVEKADVIKAAAAIPEIEKISFTKTKDKSVIIKVTERKPVAIVHCGNMFLVDKKGIRFSAAPGRYYDLPLISVDAKQKDTIDLETFEAIKKASRDVGGTFFQQISQIELLKNGDINLIFKSGKTEYTFNKNDIEKRLCHIKKLLERFQEEDTEPTHIDLRYRGLAFSSM